jgi:hypothetical protein
LKKGIEMAAPDIASNPFALMMYPSHVQEAMRGSAALRSLRGQEFHPLDKPAKPLSIEQADFDAKVDGLKLHWVDERPTTRDPSEADSSFDLL